MLLTVKGGYFFCLYLGRVFHLSGILFDPAGPREMKMTTKTEINNK